MELNFVKVVCVSTGSGIKAGTIMEGALVSTSCKCRGPYDWFIKGWSNFLYDADIEICAQCGRVYISTSIYNNTFTYTKFIPLEDDQLEKELIEEHSLSKACS